MFFLRRIIYFLRTAAASLFQNLLLNLVSTVTIALSLLIMGSFLLLRVNLEQVVEASAHGLSMSVYLKDDLTGAGVDLLGKKLGGLPGVARLTFLSKEQALADLKQVLGSQGGLLEGLEENPLPASFELELKPDMGDQRAIEALAGRIRELSGVDEVSYVWEWAEKLKVFAGFIRLGGFMVGGLLFLAVIFIIANTIKLTVLARQDELYIMSLIGATGGFIRTPFLVEGMVQGLAGSLAALGVLFLVHALFIARVELPLGLSGVKLIFLPPGQCWFLLASGAVLGFGGSLIASGRYRPR
ncbi:MAG: permease-like cell division protein FtsX [Thermodesulfobacteriota bacterium]